MITLQMTLGEQTTGLYSFTLVDAEGIGLPSTEIEALTLTYYDVATRVILNDREEQDVLNTNDVTLATAGDPPVTTVTWTLQPSDTIIVDDNWPTEPHAALFRWTWDTGRRHGPHSVIFGIENLGRPRPVPELLVTRREHTYGRRIGGLADGTSYTRSLLRRTG